MLLREHNYILKSKRNANREMKFLYSGKWKMCKTRAVNPHSKMPRVGKHCVNIWLRPEQIFKLMLQSIRGFIKEIFRVFIVAFLFNFSIDIYHSIFSLFELIVYQYEQFRFAQNIYNLSRDQSALMRVILAYSTKYNFSDSLDMFIINSRFFLVIYMFLLNYLCT